MKGKDGMQIRLPLFFLILLSASWCLGFQLPRTTLQVHEIHPTVESKAAQEQAVDARKRLISVTENAQKALQIAATNNTPDAQASAAEAQRQVADAQQNAVAAEKKAQETQSASISQQDWIRIETVLQSKRDDYEIKMKHNSTLAATLVLAGIALALLAAVAGFLRKSIMAGILSIVVTTVVGIPKLFPINQRADYYRTLFVQSSSLLLQAQLRLNPTLADYNEFAHDIEVLAEYETKTFPSSGDVAQNTQDLMKEIAASSAPTR